MLWLWLILGLGLAVFLWASLVERNLFVVRRDSVKVLPNGSAPIVVLHISDIHLAPWQHRKARWVKNLARLKPDLVIDTGDNLGHLDAVPAAIDALSELIKLPGAFVNGSNDYHGPELRNPFAYLAKPSTPANNRPIETEKLVSALDQGWLNLNNRSGELSIKGSTIRLVGLDDPHDGLAKLNSIRVRGGAAVQIGVAHAPYLEVIDALGESDIVFAGHTHGGQVCLPGGRALVTNCDLPAKHARGLSKWPTKNGYTYLNVCAGLGTSIFAPVRLFCRPEVRLVTLLPRD